MKTLIHLIDQLAQDLRYGVRTLARAPGFTAVAIGVLALGIGLNVVGFGAINAVLLRPLPFPDAHQLVGINEFYQGSPSGVSLANFFDWQDRQRTLSALAAFCSTRVSLTDAGETDSVEALAATADLFAVLGVAPVEGRTFVPGDDQPGAPPVVVLSDNLWRRRFNAAPLVGSTVRVDGVPSTVIGIMPPGFCFPDRAQLWHPLTVNRATLNRVNHSVWAVARLHRGRTIEEARAEMQLIGDQLAREYPDAVGKTRPLVMPLRHLMIDTEIRLAVLLSMAGAGFVLLIGCANLANLVLARGSAQGREIGIRATLGASQRCIIRLVLRQGLVSALLGIVLGLGLSLAATRTLRSLLLGVSPLDLLSYAVMSGVLLAAALLACYLPARRASRVDPVVSLRHE